MVSMNQPLLNKLGAAYSRATTANTLPIFITTLYEFSTELFHNAVFKKAVLAIKDKGRKEESLLKKLEKEAMIELEERYSKVIAYVDENGITDLEIRRVLKLFKEPGDVADHYITFNRFNMLKLALSRLFETRNGMHQNFVKKLAEIDEKEQIKDDTFAPRYLAFTKENWRIEQIREIRDWYALRQIEFFFEYYDTTAFNKAFNMRLKNGQSCRDLRKHWEAFIYYGLANNPDCIKNLFDMDSYKYYIGLVFDSIKQALPCSIQPKQTLPVPILFSFFPNTGEFITNDWLIEFQAGEDPVRLINMVLIAGEKGLSRLKAYNALFNSGHDGVKELSTKETKKMLDLITQVNKQFRLAKKPKFLLPRKNENNTKDRIIMISSSYKRS